MNADRHGGFHRGRPADPGPVLQTWASPRWAKFSLLPLTLFVLVHGLLRHRVGAELTCAWIVWLPIWWCCLRQRIELTTDALLVKTLRWRWLPRTDLQDAQLVHRGIALRPRSGRRITSGVAATRSPIPAMYEGAEEIRDAVNEWAGVTEPRPPAPDPPAPGWNHRTGTQG